MGDVREEVGLPDKGMHLTPVECPLLEHLARNVGRIVSHGELLKTMSIRNIGALGQHISRLRKKTEVDPAPPRVIITHRGLGYPFAREEQARRFPQLDYQYGEKP